MNLEFLKKNRKLLDAFHFGLERESLRIDSNGNISRCPHPKSFGSPLTHPHVNTDFGEQQLEWNTPPKTSFRDAQKFLEDLVHFSLKKNPKELFWPFSMPPCLDKIQIAHYGSSHAGRKKEIYREGLRDRYGMNLQMISGIHFNFSFDLPFWEKLHTHEKSSLPIQEFINEKYLGLIRNFLREGWLLSYLFGASPAVDLSYIDLPKGFQKIGEAFVGPHATSIRTSHLGYYSRVQNQLAISLNSLDEYIEEMRTAISTPKEEYFSIPSQLNNHILQIENEHYSRIRPKANSKNGESPLEALQSRGIEYIEVRTIDLDPYHPAGITAEQIDFLHCFLLYCMNKRAPLLSKQCQICLTCNQNKVALEGRKKGLILREKNEISLENWGMRIFKSMEPIAKLLGKEKNLNLQKEKVKNASLTPSALIAESLNHSTYQHLGVKLAKSHKKTLLSTSLASKQLKHFEKQVIDSRIENQKLETAASILVDGYEDLELSTQILIQKALEWNINVEVLDRTDQLLRLEKEGHIEYVKEATKTSKDSYIVAHLIENKQITKEILKRKNLRVPEGKSYTSIDAAKIDLPHYLKKKSVIKPKSTNFGLGVFIIDPHDEKEAYRALKQGFSYGPSVLIEEFCPGDEYRFLIIDGKCIGVVKRIPSHVVGDGASTIQSLVHSKNHDPSYYRDPKTFLRLGPEEKKNLKQQRLTQKSTPKKGEEIFLRHNSNVSTGGDAHDVTDKIHPGYFQIALQATHAIDAKICGVDMVVSKPKKAPTSKSYAIIELNYNPVLYIHAYPFKGHRRDVATPLLHLLGYSKYA